MLKNDATVVDLRYTQRCLEEKGYDLHGSPLVEDNSTNRPATEIPEFRECANKAYTM
jgi:hypothetical protein